MSENKNIPDGFVINERRGPYTNHNGPFYIKEEGNKWIHGAYILDRHCNAANIAHGGMLMAFADGVLGHTVYYKTKRAGVTIKFNSEFYCLIFCKIDERIGEQLTLIIANFFLKVKKP